MLALQLTPEPENRSINEGDTVTFSAVLTRAPDADIEVRISSADETALTTDPTGLSFTATNFDMAQTVTVTAPQDDDADSETVQITISVTGLDDITFNVTVNDDDTQALQVNRNAVTVEEDASETIEVTLAAQPQADVEVAIATSNDKVELNPTTLTFTPNNWNTAQEVTITGADDDDTNDELSTLTISSRGLPDVTVTVNVTDPDSLAIVGAPAMINLQEGSTATAAISLNFRPSNTVTVNIDSDDPDAVGARPARLAFTPENYNMPQVVTFTGTQDDDVANETTVVRLTGVGPEVTINASVTDDDVLGISANPMLLTVPENGMGTFEVRLSFRPAADVTVSAVSADASVATAAPAMLTFSTSNWDQPQTITVSGIDDANLVDGMTNINLTAAGLPASMVAVTVRDDDRQGIVIDNFQVPVTEGQTNTFNVSLRFAPAADVTVAVASADTTLATVAPAMLTFTTANYNVPQPVTVTALQDNDLDNEMVNVTVSAAGLMTETVNVTITDDDQQGFVINPANVTVNEGAGATVSVNLNFQPAGTVRVVITNSNPAAVSFMPATGIVFTPANFNQPQTITINGLQDSNTMNETAALTLVAPGTPDGTVNISVTDDDAQRIVASPTAASVVEGQSTNVDVTLAFQPTADVTVAVASSAPGVATVTPATLTFTPANYNVAQQVTVTGTQDNDTADGNAMVTLLSAGLTAVNVAVTVTDDDLQAIVLDRTAVTVAEGGTQNANVSLQFRPAADVTVTVASADTTAATATPATLTFTPMNFNVPQMITIGGAQDADTTDDTTNITVSAPGVADRTIAVTVTDDDVQSVVVAQNTLTVAEGGTATIDVSLQFQPSSATTVFVNSSDPTKATVNPTVLTFTAANFNQNQQITVRGAQDLDVANDNITVVLSSPGLNSANVAVTVTDDDVQAIVANPGNVTVTEGASASLRVNLAFQPAANITVNVASLDATAATVDRATLTFTPTDFNVPQVITVSGVQDADVVDDMTSVSLTAAGVPVVNVPVTVADINQLALSAAPTSLALTEGGAAGTFTVVLTQQPSATVTVNVGSSDAGAASVMPGTLTFDGTTWDTPQTVTVSPADDNDTVNENATITVSSAGLTSRTITVAVTDDDTQAITVDNAAVTVAEGGTATVMVNLAFNPINPTIVTVVSGNASAVTVTPATLTFTAANFATGQAVTLTGLQDANLADENVTVTLINPFAPSAQVAVTVTDDDTQAIRLTETLLNLDEGDVRSVGVSLAFQPAADVTLTVASADTGLVTAAPATLTFTAANFSAPQLVTLTAVQDDDTANGSTTVTVSGAGAANGVITANVNDDDAQSLTLSANALTITEGNNGTFTVRLAFNPLADTMVTIASSDAGAATVTPATLTFTAANFATPQTVTVTGADDDDTVNENPTITVSTGVAANQNVSVTVVDDDAQALQLNQTAVNLTEGGTADFTVRLAFNPINDVSVTVVSADTGAATVNPQTVTFTAANFATPQTVTVTGAQDDDVADETATITVFGGVAPNATVTANITDDDTQRIVASPTALTVNEGSSGSLAVTLAFRPTANVTVTAASDAAAVATVAPATLTFTPMNFNQPQTVTVSGVSDANVVDDTANVTLSSGGLANVVVPTTVVDIDQLNLQVNPTSLAVTEGGAAAPFTVVLTQQPAADVTVNVASSDTGAATVSAATLTFTPANWNMQQTVNVAPVDDADINAENVTVTVSSAGLTSRTVSVAVADDDSQQIQVTATTLTLNEGGTATFDVSLSADPVNPATITVVSGDPGAASVAPATLTFTSANFGTNQRVTVTGVTDNDLANETVTITLTTPVAANVAVTANVTDDDAQVIQVSQTTLNLAEGNSTTVGVNLAFQPAADVTITITSTDTGAVTTNPASLTFTAANFATQQQVTLTAAQDADTLNENTFVSLTGGGAAEQRVTVSVTDDDAQAITLTPTALTVAEQGTGTFTARLAFDPVTAATVTIVSSDAGAATGAPATLTFNSGNYQTPQTVTVTGIDDTDTADETVTVTASSAVANNQSVTVTVTDNDNQVLVVTPAMLTVAEGGTGMFSVALQFQPSADTTVFISSSDPTAGTVNPTVLTFTPANFGTPQNVTVTGVEDDDVANDAATITVNLPGETSATVAATITDNDTQALIATPATLSVNEGNNTSLSVSLAFRPGANTVVNVASADITAATVTPATLTFTAANYNQPQALTVTGVNDADTTDDATQIQLTSAGITQLNVPVTVADDDVLNLNVTPTSLSLTEGGAGQNVGVVLTQQPAGNVVVTVASSNTDKATATPATLTFTSTTWNIAQNVAVVPVEDEDVVDDDITVTISSMGLTNRTVSVSVTDNDTQAIVLRTPAGAITAGGTLNEGDTLTYTVELAFNPLTETTVTVVSADTGAVTVSPSTLTYSGVNFGTARTVTLTAVEDVDLSNEVITITHSSPVAPSVQYNATVTDDDVQALQLSTNTVALNEGANTTVGVNLAFQPANDVTLTVTSSDAGAATVTPTTLTFTPANFNAQQLVTITAVDDDDTVDENTTIAVTGGGLPLSTIAVSVSDGDVQGIQLTSTAVTVAEDNTNTFRVRLDFDPVTTATVTLTTSDAGAATVAPATLVFTSANWNVEQTVTVTGVDDLDTNNENVTVTLASPVAPTRTVAVTVTDPDSQAFVITDGGGAALTALTVAEEGTGTFRVNLAFDPVSAVSVTVVSSDNAQASVTPTTLTFNSGNYLTPQVVTVSGTSDADTVNENATVTVFGGPAPNAVVAVTVTDDDTQAINVSQTNLTVTEGGATTLNVSLAFDPLADFTVNLVSADAGAASATPATLTFNSSNYQLAQAVTVAGVQDDDAMAENTTITLSSAVMGGAANVVVNVAVTEDDTQTIQLVPATNLTVAEQGTSTFTVRLSNNPVNAATVTLNTSDAGAATVDLPTVMFDNTNWNMPRTITVTGVDDNDIANETVTITAASMIAADQTLTVNVTDNDTQAFQIAGSPLTVAETMTSTFTVRLAFNPLADQVVTFASSDIGAFTVTPATFTFTNANWNMPQIITVAGVADSDTNNEAGTVTVAGAGAPNGTVNVTVTDPNVQAVQTTPAAVTVTESATVTYTVRLAFNPVNPTTVTITSDDAGAATASPSQLNFNSSNWNVPQTVTVSALSDDDAMGETVTLAHATPVAATANVTVTVTEDDVQAIQLSTAPIVAITEAGSGTLTVRLAFNPVTATTVTIANSDPGAATVTPATLTFNAMNYTVPQTVTVNGVNDLDAMDETLTLTFSGGGAAASPTRTVTVDDDDDQDIVVSTATVAVTEGNTMTFTVSLDQDPVFATTISITSADPAAVTVTPSVVITSANYLAGETVTVTGVDDADAGDEVVALTLSTNSTVAPDATVVATVDDDEVQAVRVQQMGADVMNLALTEGSSTAVQVFLAADPGPNGATVTITSTDTEALSFAPASITFTQGNFGTGVPVTITALEDVDALAERLAATFTIATGSPATTTVVIQTTENDVQALQVTPLTLTVVEGDTQNVSVRLAARPPNNVDVTATSNNLFAVLVDPQVITFTPANWNLPQNFGVQGQQDLDLDDEATTVTFDAPGLPLVDVNVAVDDDDRQSVIYAPVGGVTLAEGGMAMTYTARLAFIPSAATGTRAPGVVNFASSDTGAVTVMPAMMTFNSMNYTTPQTLTVAPQDDCDVQNEAVTINATEDQTFLPSQFPVTVTDDDTQAYIVTPTTVTATETGNNGTFTVALAFCPAGPTNVTLTSSDIGAFTVAPATFNFTAANFATPQMATVSGVMDDDVVNEAGTVTITSTLAPNATVGVTVFDDDTQAIVAADFGAGLIFDEGGTANFTVRLAFRPQNNRTVTLVSTAPGIATVTPAAFVFTSTTWNITQTATVTGTQDNDLRDEGGAVVLLDSAGMPAVVQQTVPLTLVRDDDTQSIQTSAMVALVDPLNAAMPTAVQLPVSLEFEPLSVPETITFINPDPTRFTVTPASLDFTNLNFGTQQFFTLTPVNDNDILDHALVATLRSDRMMAAPDATADATVAVSIQDLDVQVIQVTAGDLNLTEDGGMAGEGNYEVSLMFNPTTPYTVTLAAVDGMQNAIALQPATFTFTAANFGTTQTATATALTDDDLLDETEMIQFTGVGSATVTRTVNVTDDDQQALTISNANPTVVEGGTTQITVRLAFRPAAMHTVLLTTGDAATATTTPTALMFDDTDFDVPQNVTIHGIDETFLDLNDGTTTIMFDDTDPGCGATAGCVAGRESAMDVNGNVTVTDDDVQQIVLANVPATLATSVQEGGPGVQFTVQLAFPPPNNQTNAELVSITSSMAANVGFSPANLLFNTTTNPWNVAQTVTVTVSDDMDTLHHQINGVVTAQTDPNSATANQPVRIIDDEITTLNQVDYTDVIGATQFTKRQGVQWGTTRNAIVGRDAMGNAVVRTFDRELNALTGALTGGMAVTTAPVETLAFNGTDFGAFYLTTGGIQFQRVPQDGSMVSTDTLLAAPFGTTPADFWASWDGTNWAVVFRDDVTAALWFQTVSNAGVVSAGLPVTPDDATDDVHPNIHPNTGGHAVLYTSDQDVRCARTSGALFADTNLPGFGTTGPFVSSVQVTSGNLAVVYRGPAGITIATVDPDNCTEVGAHLVVRGPDFYTSLPPTIAYNGNEFVVAYTRQVGAERRVGVTLVDTATAAFSDRDFGVGDRPSATWAGDRWVLHRMDPSAMTTNSAVVTTGSLENQAP